MIGEIRVPSITGRPLPVAESVWRAPVEPVSTRGVADEVRVA